MMLAPVYVFMRIGALQQQLTFVVPKDAKLAPNCFILKKSKEYIISTHLLIPDIFNSD
jgi:hypothetical protein